MDFNTTISPLDLIFTIKQEARRYQELQDEGDETEDGGETVAKVTNLYQLGLSLVGKAWDLEDEAEAAVKSLTGAADCHDSTEIAEAPMEDEILTELWGLFGTAVRLEDQEDREQILQLAELLMDYHGLDMRVAGR